MATTFVVLVPFFFLGNASGHDFNFHLASWMDVAAQWRQGVLFPRWAAWANYGYGEPRFIFYPPASWLLGAALSLVLPWRVVPGAYIWLVLTLAGAAMFRLAREWLQASEPAAGATRTATLAAVLYAVNPYHLLLAYFRSDYAELLAGALFPLLVLYAVRPAVADGRPARPAIAPLAFVFAAIWLANAPAAVVASYGVALLLVVLAVLRRSAATLIAGGAALLLGLGLASFYIIPAAFEQQWVNIGQALSAGLRWQDNFLFHSLDPKQDLFGALVSTLAATEIAVTTAAVLALRRSRDATQLAAREFRGAFLGLAVASTALMLPVSWFAWRALPEMPFVQFPWRWLVPLGVAFAAFAAQAIRQARAPVLWTLLLGAMLLGVAGELVHRCWWDSQDVPALRAAIGEGQGYEGADEYVPRGGEIYELPLLAPRVTVVPNPQASLPADYGPRAEVKVERWEAERKVFTSEASRPATVALRLMNYPAWQVRIDGQVVEAESQEDTGQILIPLPAGRCSVQLEFRRTKDRTAGTALTGIAALFWLGLVLTGRRRPAQSGRVTQP